MNSERIPGVRSILIDNSLPLVTEIADANPSILVIGTATDGPINTPVQVSSPNKLGARTQEAANLQNSLFGITAPGATLVRGAIEVFQGTVAGTPDIRCLRMGKTAAKASVKLQNSLAEDTITLEAVYAGAIYNDVEVKISGDWLYVTSPKRDKVSQFNLNDYDTPGALVNAILSDSNCAEVIVATAEVDTIEGELQSPAASVTPASVSGTPAKPLFALIAVTEEATMTDEEITGGSSSVTLSRGANYQTPPASVDDADDDPTKYAFRTIKASVVRRQVAVNQVGGQNVLDLRYHNGEFYGGNIIPGTITILDANNQAYTSDTDRGDDGFFVKQSAMLAETPDNNEFIATYTGIIKLRKEGGDIPQVGEMFTVSFDRYAFAYISDEVVGSAGVDAIQVKYIPSVRNETVDPKLWDAQADTTGPLTVVYVMAADYASTEPNSGEMVINAETGECKFHADESGQTITIAYYIDYRAFGAPDTAPHDTTERFVQVASGPTENLHYSLGGTNVSNSVNFGAALPETIKVTYKYDKALGIGNAQNEGECWLSADGRTIHFDPIPTGNVTLTYQHYQGMPAFATAGTLTGGKNGIFMEPDNIYASLQDAFEVLANYDVDIIAFPGVYVDSMKSGFDASGSPANVNCAYHTLINNFLRQLSEDYRETIGVISMSPYPGAATSQPGYNHMLSNIGVLTGQVKPEDLEAYHKELTEPSPAHPNKAATVMDDFESYRGLVSVCAFEPLFPKGVYETAYYGTGECFYAGLLSSTPIAEGMTNKQLKGLIQLRYKMTYRQLEKMVQMRYVTAAISGSGTPYIVDGMTAARNVSETDRSDYTRVSTIRVVKDVLTDVRETARKYIGKPNDSVMQVALDDEIERLLNAKTEWGILAPGSRAEVIANPTDRVLGKLHVELTLRLRFEIREVFVTTTLAA